MSSQHQSPCRECPFSRACPPKIGNDDPTVYVGQAYGPFSLTCHLDPDYWVLKAQFERAEITGPEFQKRLLQCAGAAVFRANVGVAEWMPGEFLRAAPDPVKVFATAAELLAHHLEVPLAEAEALLAQSPPALLFSRELAKLSRPGQIWKPEAKEDT